jgi:hypothetical protein
MGHSLEPIGQTHSNPEPVGFVGALVHGFDTQTRWVCLTRWVQVQGCGVAWSLVFWVAGGGGGGGPKGPGARLRRHHRTRNIFSKIKNPMGKCFYEPLTPMGHVLHVAHNPDTVIHSQLL